MSGQECPSRSIRHRNAGKPIRHMQGAPTPLTTPRHASLKGPAGQAKPVFLTLDFAARFTIAPNRREEAATERWAFSALTVIVVDLESLQRDAARTMADRPDQNRYSSWKWFITW